VAWRSRQVDLRCGQCEAIFAHVRVSAVYRILHLRTVDTDAQIMPRPGYSVNEESRQRSARAEQSGDPALIESERRVADYLRRVAGEIIYDLRCRCGLRYLRSSPELTKQILRTKGQWVTLSPNIATWTRNS
jgi:hypothetical protein